MLIKDFKISNFLNHKETWITFDPVTVLVGPNNGGKTALFDALQNFSMVARGQISTAFGPGPYSFHAVRSNEASPYAPIRFEATLQPRDGDPLVYEIEYGHAGYETYSIHQEILRDSTDDRVLFNRSEDICEFDEVDQYLSPDRGLLASVRRLRLELGEEADERWPRLSDIAMRISRVTKYRFVPSDLCRPSELPDPLESGPGHLPRMSYQGRNLAAILYQMAESEEPTLESIVGFLRTAVEGFDGFEFNTTGTNEIGFSVRFTDSRGVVNAPRLSSGTLTLIGFVTLLGGPSLGDVVCLEEPENGLTPASIESLYTSLTDAVTSDSATQVIMSSHSPYVLTTAWNGDSRSFVRYVGASEGRAYVRPLQDVVEASGELAWGEFSNMSTQVAARMLSGV